MVPVLNLFGGLLPSGGTVVILAKARRKCGSVGLPRQGVPRALPRDGR